MSARTASTTHTWIGSLALAAVILCPASAAAQAFSTDTADESEAPGATPLEWYAPMDTPAAPEARPKEVQSVCAIGRSGDQCASIFLLELTIRGGNVDISEFDVGLLVNQGREQAWGATIGAVGYEGEGGWLAKGRFRRWLDNWVGIDLALGAGKLGTYEQRALGGVAEVALELGDVIAFSAGLNTVVDPYTQDRRMAATAGVRLGLVPLWVIASAFHR